MGHMMFIGIMEIEYCSDQICNNSLSREKGSSHHWAFHIQNRLHILRPLTCAIMERNIIFLLLFSISFPAKPARASDNRSIRLKEVRQRRPFIPIRNMGQGHQKLSIVGQQ